MKPHTADREKARGARRTFLAAAACLPALAAGLLLTRREQAAIPETATPDEPASSDYHETEHIRKYYRSARY